MAQMQISRKSGVLAFILELLIPGLGFLYAGAELLEGFNETPCAAGA